MPIIVPISDEMIEDVSKEVLVECLEEEMNFEEDLSIFSHSKWTMTSMYVKWKP